MSLIRYLLPKLPEAWQSWITVKLVSSGWIFKSPIWKMLFQTLSFYGGDERKIRETLIRKHEGIESVVAELCALARSTNEEAQRLSSDADPTQSEAARDKFLEAALYYFMAYFFVWDRERLREIFRMADPVFDEFRKRMKPPVEKWAFDYGAGKFYADAYYPEGVGPFPAVLIYPGNEGIKEHMATYAKYALARGMAAIAIEPPGWGESGLSGCTFSSIDDYRACTDEIYARVASDLLLDENRLATFGVSGGSLTAIIVAGFHDYIRASTGIGAPEYTKLAEVWKNALGEQKRKTYTWTGLSNEKDVMDFLTAYASDTEQVLRRIKCPAVLIHGSEDYVTKATSGQEIAGLIGTNATHQIIEGDDHLCSNSIGKGLADEIFDWLANRLGSAAIATHDPSTG